MACFLTMEAKSFFLAVTLFFWDKFRYFNGVNIHGVRVTSSLGGDQVGLDMKKEFGVSVGYFLSMFPLNLGIYGLFVPSINDIRGGLHLIDLSHKRGRNSNGIVANKNSMISNSKQGDIILKVGIEFGKGGNR